MSTRLHHVNFASSNPEQLTSFYKDVLEMGESDAYKDQQAQIKDQGYGGKVDFITDGTTEMHLSAVDLNVAFRTGQAINPMERGHIAFRTDDIEGVKSRLTERGVPFSDYGNWAIKGWHQIFFHDPDGNIVEVHQVGQPADTGA